MKKVFCLVLVLLAYNGVFAQVKIIGQSEFEKISKNFYLHKEKWKGKSYRLIFTSNASIEGNPAKDYSTRQITEFVPVDKKRFTVETTLGGKKSSSEMIVIGEKNYSRSGGEDWKEIKISNKESSGFKEPSAKSDENAEIRFLGSEIFNGQKAEVYERISQTKTADQKSGLEKTAINKTKYWLDNNGLLLKIEYENETENGEDTYRTQMTTIWELDDEMKIEAPKIKATK